MSMKQEIETWVAALASYDKNEFEDAINTFQPIADTSKILFNCGVIRATLGEHETAVQYYQRAVQLDQYFAVAYYQQGVSNFLLGDFEEALANFNDALLYLRGNNNIDYEQLGLKFKLYSCEVLFNRGLCYIYLQQTHAGMQDLIFATNEKVVVEHDVIDEAIKEKAEGYTVFSIPVGVVFRPSDAKVRNVRTRDYLGQAKLVRQQSPAAYHRRQMSVENWARDDRPAEKLSYAAQNLVRPGLQSRSRQQSEPPIRRDIFPPTPPPETEKPIVPRPGTRREQSPNTGPQARSHSLERSNAPPRLNLGVAAFTQPPKDSSRSYVPRSESERPSDRSYDRRRDEFSSSVSQRPSREPLFGAIDNEDEPSELSNLPIRQQSLKSRRLSRQSQNTVPSSIREEEQDEVDEDGSAVWSPGSVASTNHSRGHLSSGSSRTSRPSVQRIRAKVHFDEDTRYIIFSSSVRYTDFHDQVVRKFGIRADIRIKLKDEEGDMITLGDQDDLDMAVSTCKHAAKKEGSDVGKMEVWVQTIDAPQIPGQAR